MINTPCCDHIGKVASATETHAPLAGLGTPAGDLGSCNELHRSIQPTANGCGARPFCDETAITDAEKGHHGAGPLS